MELLPQEIVNHIMSFRPTHPVSKLINEIVKDAEDDNIKCFYSYFKLQIEKNYRNISNFHEYDEITLENMNKKFKYHKYMNWESNYELNLVERDNYYMDLNYFVENYHRIDYKEIERNWDDEIERNWDDYNYEQELNEYTGEEDY